MTWPLLCGCGRLPRSQLLGGDGESDDPHSAGSLFVTHGCIVRKILRQNNSIENHLQDRIKLNNENVLGHTEIAQLAQVSEVE